MEIDQDNDKRTILHKAYEKVVYKIKNLAA
jgi:hypothetical protein